MLRVLTLLFGLSAAPMAWAHPHVFVDVELRFEQDEQGQLTGVEVTWIYDTFFSLLVLTDRGLDMDADLMLTEAEKAALLGFDLEDWPEGFDGALFAAIDGENLQFGPAEAVSVELHEGAIVTRHRRAMAPLDLDKAGKMVVQPFDPYYYAALSLMAVHGAPEGCSTEITPPDRDKAEALVAEMNSSGNEQFFEEAKVGVHFAFTLEVLCAGS